MGNLCNSFYFNNVYRVVQSQLPMDKSQIKTIGFSLLRQPGEFELEIEYIKAVNTDLAIGDYDITHVGNEL